MRNDVEDEMKATTSENGLPSDPVGGKPPEGREGNWIPTAGKRPLATVRFYGGTDEFWNRSFEMPDVELIL
jgi:hypothetical protein